MSELMEKKDLVEEVVADVTNNDLISMKEMFKAGVYCGAGTVVGVVGCYAVVTGANWLSREVVAPVRNKLKNRKQRRKAQPEKPNTEIDEEVQDVDVEQD